MQVCKKAGVLQAFQEGFNFGVTLQVNLIIRPLTRIKKNYQKQFYLVCGTDKVLKMDSQNTVGLDEVMQG